MADGAAKVVGNTRRRIDLLLHKRGHEGPNLLACEVKSRITRPKSVNATDLEKLKHLTRQNGVFKYGVGIWLSLPRLPGGSAYYAIVINGVLEGEGREDEIRLVPEPS